MRCMFNEKVKLPPVWISLIPLVLLVVLIGCVVYVFGSNSLAGASQISLLIASAMSVGLGMFFKHITWADFEKSVADKIGGVSQAIIILLMIGALGGAWMVSGIVPTMIYYGLQILTPECFLAITCFVCAIVSVVTGSSWTTVATIGVALIGIGRALGISDGWIAGAIISGAYFGDKISPLSDTTVLASSTVGTPLFTHIRYMLYTTIPTFMIALAIYVTYGLCHDVSASTSVDSYLNAISSTFYISPVLLIVPIITGIMIAKKMPSIMVLFLATMIAVFVAIIAQPHLLSEISGCKDGGIISHFKGAMIIVYGSTGIDTGLSELNNLVSTRGMAGMMSTIWLILCAMVFGGAMTVTGMLESIMRLFLRFVKTTVSAVASTVCVGSFLNTICGDQYLSIILTSSMFKNVYEQEGYEARLLSRTVEDSVTVTSVLVPWNTCGMTQATVLGVSVLAFAPYAFFNLLSPLMSIIVAASGYKIYRNVLKK